jgi:acyl-CoA reductase-like NAD-dependent aldehyde dehydrogenase
MSFVANVEPHIQDFHNLSGGKPARGSATYSIFNPATLEVVGTTPLSTAADLDDAVVAATTALKGKWSRDEGLRREALANCADILDRYIDELSRLLSLEQGKPVVSAAGEIRIASRICRYYAARIPRSEIIRETPADRVSVSRAPVGVVGLIIPWNFPITILFMKLGPALWSGNTIVIKPAPTTPLTTLRLAELLSAVLPAGVLNTVTGEGDIGEALVAHPQIAKRSFTGSTATGRRVMHSAASTLKRLTLELGGNDAAIVLEDANPDLVAPRLFASAFTNAGQLCAAVKRLYVHQRIYPQVVENLQKLAQGTKVGIGTAAATQMGPVNNRVQFDRIRGLMDEARAAGADVFDDGEALPDLPGYFLRPAIVTGFARMRVWWSRSSSGRFCRYFRSRTPKRPLHKPMPLNSDSADRYGLMIRSAPSMLLCASRPEAFISTVTPFRPIRRFRSAAPKRAASATNSAIGELTNSVSEE